MKQYRKGWISMTGEERLRQKELTGLKIKMFFGLIDLVVFMVLTYYFVSTTWSMPKGNTEAFELLVIYLLFDLKNRIKESKK